MILFVVDAGQGLTPMMRFGQNLQGGQQALILVANKVDSREIVSHAVEFYATPAPAIRYLFRVHGRNIGESVGSGSGSIP